MHPLKVVYVHIFLRIKAIPIWYTHHNKTGIPHPTIKTSKVPPSRSLLKLHRNNGWHNCVCASQSNMDLLPFHYSQFDPLYYYICHRIEITGSSLLCYFFTLRVFEQWTDGGSSSAVDEEQLEEQTLLQCSLTFNLTQLFSFVHGLFQQKKFDISSVLAL